MSNAAAQQKLENPFQDGAAMGRIVGAQHERMVIIEHAQELHSFCATMANRCKEGALSDQAEGWQKSEMLIRNFIYELQTGRHLHKRQPSLEGSAELHYLRHGETPCGMQSIPGQWAPGSRWTHDWAAVTCARCHQMRDPGAT